MMKKEGWVSEFGSCVNRQVGLGFHCFILYPIVPPPLTVYVDVKHMKEEGWVSELGSCEQQEGGPELSFSIPFFPRRLRFLWT